MFTGAINFMCNLNAFKFTQMTRLILGIALLIGCCIARGQATLVKTDKGWVSGTTDSERGLRVFKGIPFAAPPVGELRWRAPQPVRAWTDTLQATEFSASPIQNEPRPFYAWSEEFIAQPEPLSEDCLYLNVWTPAESGNEKLPVFVWIYGGGLNSGSANCAIYDGAELASKGVVFVSLNYRVGVLGFLAHPELSEESGHGASGNYGFMDQTAALDWVRRNIAAFGGDPDNVTIAGQSAGAFSVNAQIASPLAKGLFHKAILQSGGLLSGQLTQDLEQAEAAGVRFMEKAGVRSLEALRELPADSILAVSNIPGAGRFGVTRDGHFLPDTDMPAYFREGRHNQVPVIAGWVTGDGNFMGSNAMTPEAFRREADSLYGERAGAFLELFPGSTGEEVQESRSLITLLGFAGLPAHRMALASGGTSYLYQFGHVPPDKPDFPNYGAFHTSEVPFALHTLHTWDRPWQPYDRKVEDTLSSYWLNFAKTGNPNGPGLPAWEHYQYGSGDILVIDETIRTEPGLLQEELRFLDRN